MKLKTIIWTLTAVVAGLDLTAQQLKHTQFSVSGDIVSSYVWRGAYNAGASIQPSLSVSRGGFSFTAWGSKEISGPHKEIDLTAAYRFGKFGVVLTDYWWDGERYAKSDDVAYGKNNQYFHFDNHRTRHYLEAGLNYTLSERYPLTIAWYTMFWGADKKRDGSQHYSSYVEFNYLWKIRGVDVNVTAGLSPYESRLYGVNRFAVCNLSLGAAKELPITPSFSLPVFARLIFDPAHEDAHMVFGFTLR